MSRFPWFVWLLFVGATPALAEWSLIGSLNSEVVHRGASEADGEPAAGLVVEWNGQAGWFSGIQAYVASASPVPGRTRGAGVYGGWFHTLGDQQALELSISHQYFEGDFPRDWNYSEARLDFHFSRDFAVTAAVSDDYYGRGESSLLGAFRWRRPLSRNRHLLVGAGAIGRPGDDMAFAELGLGASFGLVEAALTLHHINNSHAHLLHSDRSTVSLKLSYPFR